MAAPFPCRTAKPSAEPVPPSAPVRLATLTPARSRTARGHGSVGDPAQSGAKGEDEQLAQAASMGTAPHRAPRRHKHSPGAGARFCHRWLPSLACASPCWPRHGPQDLGSARGNQPTWAAAWLNPDALCQRCASFPADITALTAPIFLTAPVPEPLGTLAVRTDLMREQ